MFSSFLKNNCDWFIQKAMFNLADEEVLTHRGQTLNEIEKFDDPRSDDEDDEDNPLRAKGNLDGML